MKVKDIVLLAATQLGIADEVQAYLDGEEENGERNAALLLTCFNVVENELALDYLPLYAEEKINTETGKIVYSDLVHSAVRIVKVTDEKGESIPYKLYAEYLQTQAGKVTVRYTYTPESKETDGESDFASPVSERLLAYGIAAEYSLSMGLLSEAAVWDKKYKESIEAIRSLQSGKRMKSRRWV